MLHSGAAWPVGEHGSGIRSNYIWGTAGGDRRPGPLLGVALLMSGFWQAAGRLLTAIENLLAVLAGASIVGVTLAVSFDVLRRLTTGVSMPAVTQLSTYVMLFLAFAPAPWILRQQAHVAVDIVPRHLGERARLWMYRVSMIMGLLLSLYLTYLFYELVIESIERNAQFYGALVVSRWLVYVPIPIAFGLLALEFGRQIFKDPAGTLQVEGA